MKYTIEEIKGMLEAVASKKQGSKAWVGALIDLQGECEDIIRDLLAKIETYQRKHAEVSAQGICPKNGDCNKDDKTWTCEKCWLSYWEGK